MCYTDWPYKHQTWNRDEILLKLKLFVHFSAAPSCEEALMIADQKVPDVEYLLAHGKVRKLKKLSPLD